MGKWTTEHYDNVLGAKMRSLVSGAIKRAKLEKLEPLISYETFVEDLDRGDSFTTSLIEVLVKEIAERRYRHNTADRGLIADQTARLLRRLSNPASVYRDRGLGRGTGGRRALDPTDYLSRPPDEFEVDDDEELGPYDTLVSSVEQTRLLTDWYEAYHPQRSWSNSSTSHVVSVPHILPSLPVPPADPSSSDRVLPPLIEAPPPQRTNIWLPPPSGLLHTNLTRQNSIRRPGRSRTADFNEFTTHRRSLARQLTSDEEATTRAEGSFASPVLDGGPPSLQSEETSWSYATPTPRRSSSQGRRFFPFGSSRRFEVIPTPRSSTSAAMDWYLPPAPPQVWGIPERTDTVRGEDTSEERSQLPRLRRGGLRAPEAMLSRHGMSVQWPLGSQSQEEPSTALAGARGSSGGDNLPSSQSSEPSEPAVPRAVSAEAAAGGS